MSKIKEEFVILEEDIIYQNFVRVAQNQGWVKQLIPKAILLLIIREVNIGALYGCHHTGAKTRGQAQWTGDHQPVTKLVEKTQQNQELMNLIQGIGLATSLNGQQLYPHSVGASKSQGGTVTAILMKIQKLERLKGDKNG